MLLLKGGHAHDPQIGLDDVIDILIIDGNIARAEKNIDEPDAQVIDCTGLEITPGLVDMHVHFRDPGLEYKEDIATGSAAAAHGGFTDVATMPNTDPVCDTGASITYQRARGEEVGLVNIHPIGALTREEKGESLAEIGDMVLAGAAGFSDDGHGVQSASMMRTCMKYVSQFDRTVIAHCEVDDLSGIGVVNAGRASTRLGMFGWPGLAEEAEVARDIALSRSTGCPLHIAHISTKRSLELVREAKAEGLPVTCEVTPLHLFLTEDDITDTYNTNLKVNPPLRTNEDATALLEGVLDGTIDAVVSDHAPHAAHEKDCEFELAAFGSVGLETTVPLLLSYMAKNNRLDFARFVELLAINPRKILRLDTLTLAPGSVASITVLDPQKKVTVDTEYLQSKSKNSAFLGRTLQGAAVIVIKDGAITYQS